jgi:hypothetical protein
VHVAQRDRHAALARARIDGSYKTTPFFDAQRGTPVVTPKVLGRGGVSRFGA